MAPLAWDVVKAHPIVASGGNNSGSFPVPRAATTMTIHAPALTGANVWSLQSVDPVDGSTWRAVNFVELATGTVKVLPNGSASTCVVFPVDIFGGGNLRIVTSGAGGAEAADRIFSVMFTKSD